MKKVLLSFLFLFLLLSIGVPAQGTDLNGMADTPWPMFQHDPQHTGRSPFLGPQLEPHCIWSYEFEDSFNRGVSAPVICPDGNLILGVGGTYVKFNPSSQEEIWRTDGGFSYATPLLAADGSFYRGVAGLFGKYSSNGTLEWDFLIDGNYIFGSSAAFGSDGNILVVHDALISIAPDGLSGWIYPYPYYSHESPAIATDGTIYASGAHDLTAFSPEGDVSWTLTTTHPTSNRTPVIGQDGTIYVLSMHGYLYAVNPSGSIKWEFAPPEAQSPYVFASSNVALGPDDTVYYVLAANPTKLIAVSTDGEERWSVPFLFNTLTGLSGIFYWQITVDRVGNAFLCHANSRCYGINPDGEVLWEYEFPLSDSIIKFGISQILVADNLIYFGDNRNTLYAFGDPTIYPILTAPEMDLTYQVESGSLPFTVTIPISSTVAPITYTVSLSNNSWLTISEISSITPSNLSLQIDPSALTPEIYHAMVTVQRGKQACTGLQIPIKLEVIPKSIALSHPIYLPIIFSGIPNPPGNFSKHILYSSQWFTDHQLATIEYIGQFRTPLVHNLPAMDAMVFSPDGNKVAIRMVGADSRRKIEIRNIKSGQIVGQIEGQFDGGGNYTPSWSPDSSRLAFVSYGDESNSDLYVANADGGGVRRLTDGTLLQDLAYWSPSNEKIAFGTSTPSYGYVNSTAIINPDGTDLQILDFSIKHYVDIPVGWSPDGKILLIYAQDGTIGSMGLWSYNMQTGEYKMLVDGNNYAGSASWSPDGAHIAFRSCRDFYDCWANIANADGSGIVQLAADAINISWSGDGQWLAFSDGDDIFVARADGTELQKITSNTGMDKFPYWTH